MHELLLFAPVIPSRHDQLLRVLSGVSGMRPRRVLERHLLFKPKRQPRSGAVQVGGSQGIQNQQAKALQGQMQGELFYLKLIGEVEERFFAIDAAAPNQKTSIDEDAEMTDERQADEVVQKRDQRSGDVYELQKQRWTLRFNDLPDVTGRRPATSRMMSTADIVDGDALVFMDALGYRCGLSIDLLLPNRHRPS